MIGACRLPQNGFSMVELLVTIVLAGIIFAAMVPFFANALKRTSGRRDSASTPPTSPRIASSRRACSPTPTSRRAT